jgi:hypothetical protein
MTRSRWILGLLAAALLAPVVGYAAKTFTSSGCPLGCEHCPLKR